MMTVQASGLSKKQLQDIKTLENQCCEYEQLNMKLNWEMLDTRSKNETNDFLCYKDNQLIGYLGLYSFGPKAKEIELTGIVHPNHRRTGVFRSLFNEAKKECSARAADRILIVTERCSSSGIEFSKSTGARYSFSEYNMKFDERTVPAYATHGITLRRADKKDHHELATIDTLCFGGDDEAAEKEESYSEDPYRISYVIELNRKTIGKIGTIAEGDGYIFGFAIKPEYRGRGFGRAALSMALEKLMAQKVTPVVLEVEVINQNALSLYKSCGFKENTIYDYYKLDI